MAGNSPDALGNGPTPGVSPSGNVGFFGTPPAPRVSSFGSTTGFVAGVGAAVQVDATFTGGIGASALTLSDVVKILKTHGLAPP